MSVHFNSSVIDPSEGALVIETASRIVDVILENGLAQIDIVHNVTMRYSLSYGLKKDYEGMRLSIVTADGNVTGTIHFKNGNPYDYTIVGYFIKTTGIGVNAEVLQPEKIAPTINRILAFYLSEKNQIEINSQRWHQIKNKINAINVELGALREMLKMVGDKQQEAYASQNSKPVLSS